MCDPVDIELPLGVEYQIWVSGTVLLTQTAERAILPYLQNHTPKNDLEEAVSGAAWRMLGWMQPLSRLNNPGFVQAACAACRSLLELRMDIELLKRNPALARCWKAFLLPRKYEAAEKLTKLSNKHNSLLADGTVMSARAFTEDSDIKSKVKAATKAHWGGKVPGHWSGKPTIYSVAEELGVEFERLYRTTYYKTSDYLHPGPGGPLATSPMEIAQTFSYAHLQSQRFFGQAMMDAVDLFEGLQNAEKIKQAIEWAMLSAAGQVMEWKEALQREVKRQSDRAAPPS